MKFSFLGKAGNWLTDEGANNGTPTFRCFCPERFECPREIKWTRQESFVISQSAFFIFHLRYEQRCHTYFTKSVARAFFVGSGIVLKRPLEPSANNKTLYVVRYSLVKLSWLVFEVSDNGAFYLIVAQYTVHVFFQNYFWLKIHDSLPLVISFIGTWYLTRRSTGSNLLHLDTHVYQCA